MVSAAFAVDVYYIAFEGLKLWKTGDPLSPHPPPKSIEKERAWEQG